MTERIQFTWMTQVAELTRIIPAKVFYPAQAHTLAHRNRPGLSFHDRGKRAASLRAEEGTPTVYASNLEKQVQFLNELLEAEDQLLLAKLEKQPAA